MKIVIGSSNKAKVAAVTSVFSDADIISVTVSSNVPSQPIGDEETLNGAINRAKNAQQLSGNAVAIGLEGGVMYLNNQLYLTNWGAIATLDGVLHTASGARIALPSQFIEEIHAGRELSDIMNEFTKREDIRHHEGAIGIFSNDHISRAAMFAQIVTLLKGQMEYGVKNRK